MFVSKAYGDLLTSVAIREVNHHMPNPSPPQAQIGLTRELLLTDLDVGMADGQLLALSLMW